MELSFWHQLCLSVVQGSAPVLLLGAAGYLLLRHQEKVKNEEQIRAENLRVQLAAIPTALAAIGEYYVAKVRLHEARARLAHDHSVQAIADHDADSQRFKSAGEELELTLTRFLLFLPDDARQAITTAVERLKLESEPAAMENAVNVLRRSLRPYFPKGTIHE